MILNLCICRSRRRVDRQLGHREDLSTMSFAGQHESYLNFRGEGSLFKACSMCFASAFTNRAFVYRVNNGFEYFKVRPS